MKQYFKAISVLGLLFFCSNLSAQINPLNAQLFYNPYIANPAMAGFDGGLNISTSFRNQWSDMPGAPKLQNTSLDYRINKVGLGINFTNQKKAGFSQSKLYGTFAYYVPLDGEDRSLQFGVNVGFQMSTINLQELDGDINDPLVANYNQRTANFDSDFGFAYTTPRFSLEGVYYSISAQNKLETSTATDYSTYYLASSLTFPLSGMSLKTKLAYRGISNFDNVLDLGVEVKMLDNKLGISTIYHSNKSAALGFSYLHNEKWDFIVLYNTAATPISSYAKGSTEIGLKAKLFK